MSRGIFIIIWNFNVWGFYSVQTDKWIFLSDRRFVIIIINLFSKIIHNTMKFGHVIWKKIKLKFKIELNYVKPEINSVILIYYKPVDLFSKQFEILPFSYVSWWWVEQFNTHVCWRFLGRWEKVTWVNEEIVSCVVWSDSQTFKNNVGFRKWTAGIHKYTKRESKNIIFLENTTTKFSKFQVENASYWHFLNYKHRNLFRTPASDQQTVAHECLENRIIYGLQVHVDDYSLVLTGYPLFQIFQVF